MTITFFTNFINHHQVPIADQFYSQLGLNYHFIATMLPPKAQLDLGYPYYSDKPYLVRAYLGGEELEKAYKLGLNSDVVIIGSAPDEFIEKRLVASKLTFRYSERWFKTKPYYLMSPWGWYNCYRQHIRHYNKKLYMLAASAYTANDVYHIGAYRNKTYKWGYFTAVYDLDIDTCLKNKADKHIKLLWCARFLKWKHPEMAVELAKRLYDNGYNFEINIIGSGEEENSIKDLIQNLDVSKYIKILGNFPNETVLKKMQEHHIFLFTSDKNEGWGAVLSEAMSNGCCAVASDKIGASPFLIQHKQNGMLFESENIDSLYESVKYLIENPKERERMAIEAYRTMHDIWSPKNAAEQFMKLCDSLLNGKDSNILEGPCSKATPTNIRRKCK